MSNAQQNSIRWLISIASFSLVVAGVVYASGKVVSQSEGTLTLVVKEERDRKEADMRLREDIKDAVDKLTRQVERLVDQINRGA